MNDISIVGWIAIIFLAALVIGTNLSLIAALRDRSKKSGSPDLLNSWKVMKNPWNDEERQWGELSDKVKQLGEHEATGEDKKSQDPG